ncbi:VanZ family protein [Psychroflexus sp. MES1-P1E]|uniref:VanZ family protein n=1 Tax=Psychroflexus sp. MES1-P1E TaxID=2058320 RepID=UPI0021556EA9|nr:VanZ family protein [Psychroflexus sp. MES1-P1E]
MPVAILCTASILVLSISDISSLPKLQISYEDKLYHFVAYFVLNSIWLIALLKKNGYQLKKILLTSLSIVVFGIIIEIVQGSLTDSRAFDILDILANSIAVVVSFFCFMLVKKSFLKK